MMNAVTEGTKVHLDLCLYEGNCFPFFKTPDGRETAPVPPILSRMTFDLERNDDEFTYRPIVGLPGEMPRTDDRYQGRPYRTGFMIMSRSGDGTSTIGKVDVTNGALELWDHGKQIAVQEPQFVPRTPDSPEGDGWLLTILNRLDENHSELAVIDANRLAAGPVARFYIPVRVRATFHGMWVPAETLRTGRFDMQVAP
jgi:carotenoid cleavage dioxygenase